MMHHNITDEITATDVAVDTATDVSYLEPQTAPFASALKPGVWGIW